MVIINEEILVMRNSVLNRLKQEQPGLEKLISDNNYFVSSIEVTFQDTNKGPSKQNYILMDFTCKQEEHIQDIKEYSFKIFNKFNEIKIIDE